MNHRVNPHNSLYLVCGFPALLAHHSPGDAIVEDPAQVTCPLCRTITVTPPLVPPLIAESEDQ